MEAIQALARVFIEQGRSLFLVGGWVRDQIWLQYGGGGVSQERLTDYDLTTDAEPTVIKQLVRQAGADAIYTVGERFGTIGAIFGDARVEITTYRSEAYTAGSRKPQVSFGTTLEGDLSRRDFTINAMARPAAGGDLIDLFGGLRDLEERSVRAVGNPDERFSEDPLRMLRAVRFAAQLSFRIEAATRAAIARDASTLRSISVERIVQELSKILVVPHPSWAVRELCDLGLMTFIVPELLDLREPPLDHRQARAPRHKDMFEHTLMVLDRAPSVLTVRWGALLHDIGKPRTMAVEDDEVHFYGHEVVGERITRRILTRLKLDRATIDRVGKIVSLSGRINSYEEDWTDGAVRRFAREAGDALDDLFMLSRSDVTSRHEERVRAAEQRVDDLHQRFVQLRQADELAHIRPPLDGVELMDMFGRGPGPWIRPIKERLLAMVIDGELSPDDKGRAAEIAREMLAAEEPAFSTRPG